MLAMISCKRTVQLLAKDMDGGLKLYERVLLTIHLKMCTFCTEIHTQLISINEGVRVLSIREELEPSNSLTPEAMSRIKSSLSEEVWH